MQQILTAPRLAAQAGVGVRPRVQGKFIYVGEAKWYVRGVTYGPFRPEADGSEYHTPQQVDRDFLQMAEAGINTVRVYTVPPRWLLDAAARHGLFVQVGVPWEQHVAFLDDPARVRSIEARVREGVRACAGHSAVLGYAVGNEIPPSIVRWYGPRRIERFLERLCDAARDEDPEALVTYVNFPTTEYLRLPFVDFSCFNVYLETPEAYTAYLARLHNLAGDRPLVMAEIGLDSRRNGLREQAQTLDWQIHTTFAGGCAGVFLFAWTDEWHRGGYDIDDWDFGLTDRDRAPKPALTAAAEAFDEVPFSADLDWPRCSVVVCSYNGAATLRDTLDAATTLDYPDYEVIVVDDGSTDGTADLARAFGVQVIRTENRGLSAARNTGLEAATGEIVVYLDDDAYPDPDWLTFLAATFLNTDHAAVGGPNIAPPDDGFVAEAVDHAPGNPMHVLLTDTVAEHIPGCNFAVRRDALRAIGGFDTRFRIAGDDVDACWRLQQQGWTLGFSPAAVVWHHRRGTVGTFWRQQKNYGQAEAMLEAKWPEKYNQLGHLRWHGRVYNGGLARLSVFRRWRVYYGVWGTNLFQAREAPPPSVLETLPLTPEWYLAIAALALLTAIGALWAPLLWAGPLLVLAAGALVFQAVRLAGHVHLGAPAGRRRLKLRGLIAFLHLMQPFARLMGRLHRGLTPWRLRGAVRLTLPRPRTATAWSEGWQAPAAWLAAVERMLYEMDVSLRRGDVYDRWDLEARGGLFGSVRLLMAVEEHGGGRQLLRFRLRPRLAPHTLLTTLLFGSLAVPAGLAGAGLTAGLLAAVAALVLLRGVRDAMAAQGALEATIEALT